MPAGTSWRLLRRVVYAASLWLPASLAAQATPVYGRIAGGQTAVPAGVYVDSVVATVNF